MSQEGRQNTATGIVSIVAALKDIREVVQKASADGHVTRDEGLDIFLALAKACIEEGLAVALMVAKSKI